MINNSTQYNTTIKNMFILVTGDTLQWLQDGLEILDDLSDSETQAAEVIDDEADQICFVPAFNGLYSPYWKKDARGLVFIVKFIRIHSTYVDTQSFIMYDK